MTPSGIQLSPLVLRDVFPFHVGFDRELRIVQVGRVMERLLGTSAVGRGFGELFRIVTPAVTPDFDTIREQSFTVFFVEVVATGMTLKGQMLASDDAFPGMMVFLCSPAVRELGALSEMGLGLNDFAVHDSAVDFLILLQTKTNTINDVRTMAERLKAEVAVRRGAEKSLKRLNDELEQRVAQRTEQLARSNQELEKEVADRMRAEEQLRLANGQLEAWVTRLEQHNRQMTLLNKMGDMLQACRSMQETYTVIRDSVQQLFPACPGTLALCDDQEDTFPIVERWGEIEEAHAKLDHDDCWGLRRARPHVNDDEHGAVCPHVTERPSGGYVCIPLAVQGRVLGLLHLRDLFGARGEGSEALAEREAQAQLIQTASEHISLAIANIRLQESLRLQSIRDPLTGLFNRRHMEESLEAEVSRARRTGKPLGIVMFDVDHFKRFNDTYGHAAGDLVLRTLGQYVARHVRSGDIACRYGGEEFVLILPGCSKESSHRRAETIRQEVSTTLSVIHEGEDIGPVRVSLGVAEFPGDGYASGAATIEAADAALYRSKQGGRDRVTLAERAPDSTVARPSPQEDGEFFNEAVAAHLRWKHHLQACVDGVGEAPPSDAVRRDDHCALGRWIRGAGSVYQALAGFEPLVTHHAHFHWLAGEIVDHLACGDRAGARALLLDDRRFSDSSASTVVAIGVLRREIEALASAPEPRALLGP